MVTSTIEANLLLSRNTIKDTSAKVIFGWRHLSADMKCILAFPCFVYRGRNVSETVKLSTKLLTIAGKRI